MSSYTRLALNSTARLERADYLYACRPRAHNGRAVCVLTLIALILSGATSGAARTSSRNSTLLNEVQKPQAAALAIHTKATERRNVSEKKPQSWMPNNAQVAKIEALLSGRLLVGAPLAERVRVYSGTREGGKRYVIGKLLTPDWHGQEFNPDHRDERRMESWQAGRYIVPLSKLPSRVSALPDTSCSQIKVIFNVELGIIQDNGCLK
ncbi:hypothetical protein FPZ54_02835 [Sphingomonas suaedae]|uniref:Uncharacterized protein n=1 Tax=Sphingomonas suaedae TaxID=2599297 RepID=A0A518RCC8_9SPHN|nr:hypothetical protein [Sphingomonas suaedae]QDX25064.1 hypothetical protein FPZ54_02835 [Sphingomonas suaedae]